MVIKMLKELSENFREFQGTFKKLTANCTSMKKYIGTINEIQEEMKNTIYEMKNKVEGIKIRLDKTEDQISELEDKIEKNSQSEK